MQPKDVKDTCKLHAGMEPGTLVLIGEFLTSAPSAPRSHNYFFLSITLFYRCHSKEVIISQSADSDNVL